jgi:UDP-N-acetylmuramoylalanine-D-glutamate ligase
LLDASTQLFVGTQAAQALARTDTTKTQIYGSTGSYTFTDNTFYHDDSPIGSDEGMQLVGIHNRYNACVLFGICDQLSIPYEPTFSALQQFDGLEHRIELVGTYG